MFTNAKIVGNQTRIKNEKTKTGIKDTYLDHFTSQMFSSYKKINGATAKQAALTNFLSTLPDNVYSPVWRIQGELNSMYM